MSVVNIMRETPVRVTWLTWYTRDFHTHR